MFAGKAYLILGAPSPSSLDLVKDLIAGVHPWDKMPSVFYPAGQASEIAKTGTEPELADFVSYQQWSELPPLSKDDTVFIIAQGRENPPSQIEAFKTWLQASNVSIGRVFALVDCALLEKSLELIPWFESCIHFADCVLLSNRQGVSSKWLNQFIKQFQQKKYPCHFEMLKEGRPVDNPAFLLHPEARRLSLIFDELDACDFLELDEDNLPEEPFDLSIPADPYLVRLANGDYAIKLPDINEFL